MAVSNFNTIYAIDSSEATYSILTQVNPFASHLVKQNQTVRVILLSEAEMRDVCRRRNVPDQEALLVLINGEIIGERNIVDRVKNLAVPAVPNYSNPYSRNHTSMGPGLPRRINEDPRDSNPTNVRDRMTETTVREERTIAPPASAPDMIRVSEAGTSSPARALIAPSSMSAPLSGSASELIDTYFVYSDGNGPPASMSSKVSGQ